MYKDIILKAIVLCRDGLAPYIVTHIKLKYANEHMDDWTFWRKRVLYDLPNASQKQKQESVNELTKNLSPADCFSLMTYTYWDRIFKSLLAQKTTPDFFLKQCLLIRSTIKLIIAPIDGYEPDISKEECREALAAVEYILNCVDSPLASQVQTLQKEIELESMASAIKMSPYDTYSRARNTTSICTESVFSAIAKIPHGKVMTYADVAQYITGSRDGAQAVSTILKNNSQWKNCHRVILAEGKLSPGYKDGQGQGLQRKELEAEGVTFDYMGNVNLRLHKWHWRKENQ